MSTERPAASALSDPILLAAERRRREKAEAERRRHDQAESEQAEAPDAAPVSQYRIRGQHVAMPGEGRDSEAAEGSRAEAARKGTPAVDDEPEAADEGYPRVPEGLYPVVLSGCTQRELWGRWRWLLTWTVAEGPAEGVELPHYLPRPKDPKARPRPGWALAAAYRVARGERLPRNLARLNPKVYLGGAVFEARVRDVVRDSFGAKVAPAARYSRIVNLERRLTGKGGGP